jgi:DNA polymerase-3 subunit epsilon
LLDALLLAAVYVELLGERQATLGLDLSLPSDRPVGLGPSKAAQRPDPLPPRIDANVEIAHQHFVKSLGPQALWLRFALGSQAAAADAGA